MNTATNESDATSLYSIMSRQEQVESEFHSLPMKEQDELFKRVAEHGGLPDEHDRQLFVSIYLGGRNTALTMTRLRLSKIILRHAEPGEIRAFSIGIGGIFLAGASSEEVEAAHGWMEA